MHHHVHSHGLHGYCRSSSLPDLDHDTFRKLRKRIDEEVSRSREHFVSRHKAQYPDEPLPLWIVVELMTMGMLFTFYNGMKKNLRASVAARYKVSEEVFTSWMRTLNHLRNVCAHHSRLWNRVFGLSPKIPRGKKHPEWHCPKTIVSNKTYGVLSVVYYLLKMIDEKQAKEWRDSLANLLIAYGDRISSETGFPEDWEKSSLWW